jgi:predicted dehydrogenase
MAQRKRIGIFGGGGILGAHAPGFTAIPDEAQVVAVAEPVAEKADRIRKLLGPEVAIYPDYGTLLAQADVDAVDILLPHYLHLPATLAAAAAGKHVLVEKVMARNVAECDAMIAACAAAGVTLTVSHDRRYDPHWAALKRVVASGLLGRIAYWKLDHNQDVAPAAYGIAWAAQKELLGGGAIMSCLTHQIDALRWYGGEVASVACLTQVLPARMEGETCGAILARMASGAMAQLTINWMTRTNSAANGLYYEMVHVCGDRGEAFYVNNRGTWVLPHEGSDPNALIPCGPRPDDKGFYPVLAEGGGRGHVNLIGQWLKLLRGEPHEITTTGADARHTVAVAEAAYRAETLGRTIHLSELGA